jgi:hypothetical protein
MSYCARHGGDGYSSDCPLCAAEERHAELLESNAANTAALIEATRRTADEAEYRRQNPGDYDCPHCKYRSLKWNATRCPLCREPVNDEYWRVVAERKERARQAALALAALEAEKQAQLAPILAEQRAAEQRRKWEDLKRSRRRPTIVRLAWLYFAYLLPTLTILASFYIGSLFGIGVADIGPEQITAFLRENLVWYLIPALNWVQVISGIVQAESTGQFVLFATALGALTSLGAFFFYVMLRE